MFSWSLNVTRLNCVVFQLDDGISLDRLNELTIEEGPVAPAATPTLGGGKKGKKPNRQKQRKEKKEAELQKMREEAEKEVEGQVDRGKLESDAINELLVPMRLRVSEVSFTLAKVNQSYNPLIMFICVQNRYPLMDTGRLAFIPRNSSRAFD